MASLSGYWSGHSRKKSSKDHSTPFDLDSARKWYSKWKEYLTIAAIAWFFFSLYPLFQHFVGHAVQVSARTSTKASAANARPIATHCQREPPRCRYEDGDRTSYRKHSPA